MRPEPMPAPKAPREIRVAVTGTARITPGIRRLVFAAEGLARAFATPRGAHAPYFKLLLGSPECPIIRTYSVRRLDEVRDELHVDFVLHEDDGPGSSFGRNARPGDEVLLRGPGHMAPAPCSQCRLAADHAGLPAMAHLLEHLPAHATGNAVIEVPDAAEIQDLRAPTGIALEWLVREKNRPSLIPRRFAEWAAPTAPDALVWAGAEAAIARTVRKTGRASWGIPATGCQVLNYWRVGRPEGSFSFIS